MFCSSWGLLFSTSGLVLILWTDGWGPALCTGGIRPLIWFGDWGSLLWVGGKTSGCTSSLSSFEFLNCALNSERKKGEIYEVFEIILVNINTYQQN